MYREDSDFSNFLFNKNLHAYKLVNEIFMDNIFYKFNFRYGNVKRF